MTRIVLVRHGQTEWNREARFRGRVDVGLNDHGRAQAEACARQLAARWKPVALYSSPLSRAVHTADVVAKHCGLHAAVRPHLIDMNFGEWHGLTLEEARARWPDLVAAWLRDPASVRPPHGEPLETLRDRAVSEIRSLAHAHGNATIALVSHDAVIRVLVLAALDAPLSAFFRVGQETGAISILDADEHDLRLVAANDTCHLS